METLRILVAEDHPLFRGGMVSLLSSVAGFEVAGEATTGEEAAARAAEFQPDVVLIDLQMPKVNGIEATRRIVTESSSIRVLVVTLLEDDESVFMALRAGARGYVLKDADEEEVIRAIRAVGRGEAIFSPAIASRVLAYFAAPRPRRRPAPGISDAHRAGARDPAPHSTRTPQLHHRQGAVAEHQDGWQLRLERLHQAAGRRPGGGDYPCQGGRPELGQGAPASSGRFHAAA